MPPKKRGNPPGKASSTLEPSGMKVVELREELEKLGLETSGKKEELVARLEDALKGPAPSKKVKVESACSAEVDYSKMKLTELRAELESKGLDSKGKKAELVERLEDALKGPAPSKKVKVEPAASSAEVDYSKMKLTELRAELESKGLDSKGKKAELVARLEDATTTTGEVPKKEEPEEEESEAMEETDFSKARRALASADSAGKTKKKSVKQRKVDGHCGLPSAQVVADWDCMLNQTNIGHNNNKYYVIQILQAGSFVVFTRWGRVGEPGQQATKRFATVEEAEKEFKKKFSDKTKNKWDDRHAFVPAPGKYTLLEMDEDDDGDDEELVNKLAALDEPDGAPVVKAKVRACTLDQPTQDFLRLIFNTDTFNNAMKALEIDTKKMPLGKLSKSQIAKGFEALEALEKALDQGAARVTLAEFTSKFYTIIPHDFGRRPPPVIGDKETLQKKFDMLVILGDIELAQGMQKDQVKKEPVVAGEVPHKLDLHYHSLKTDMTLLDPASHEYQVIVQYMNATEPPWRSLTLLHVWRVNRDKVERRFSEHEALTNRKLLWHGTNVAVVAAILKSGLRIMPHSGGRVGKGIYLASENSKSAGYVRCSADGTGIMFLNETALGKEHIITMDDHQLTTPPDGYDSILAKGRTEPDPKSDTTLMLDSKPVSIPQGKPIPTSYASSSFQQSEYLVYKESQTRIRYMLQIKFS